MVDDRPRSKGSRVRGRSKKAIPSRHITKSARTNLEMRQANPEPSADDPSSDFGSSLGFLASAQRQAQARRASADRRSERALWEMFIYSTEEIAEQLRSMSKGRFRELIRPVNALKKLRSDPGSAEAFCRYLGDKRPDVRLVAINVMLALGQAGRALGLVEHFRPHVFRGLQDSAPDIRELLVSSIKWFSSARNPHHREAFEAAVKLLADPVTPIRLQA